VTESFLPMQVFRIITKLNILSWCKINGYVQFRAVIRHWITVKLYLGRTYLVVNS